MVSQINIREKLMRLAAERILVLDGAMGALIQAYRSPSGEPLGEDDFRGLSGPDDRGERFRNHPKVLKGCNDLLCLTKPELISGIHDDYLKAGADIIETCSFNATAVSLSDFGLGDLAYEISKASAALARKAADSFSTNDKPRFVAGSMGPTSKSAGLSNDMNDPGKRAITWDELEAAYYDNARGLLDGGADILVIETVFDTLNAKAAVFAVRRLAEERRADVPLVISATVANKGGRLLSGQSLEAFCVSVLHADPLALGLNCSFGAEKLKPHIAAISAAVPCLVSAYPNAGFPDARGVYDESPESMANHIEEYLRDGLVNIIGGCCGSTPAHIALIAERAKKYTPRPLPRLPKKTMLAGFDVLEIKREPGPVKIGECTNTAGSRKFMSLVEEENYDDAVEIALDMADAGVSIIDVCMDSLPGAKAAMTNFLNLALVYPDIAGLPVMIDSSRWDVIEAGLKCLPGKGLANSISLKEGEAEFLRRARLVRNFGAAAVVMLIDEKGVAASYERRIAVAARSWKLLTDIGFPPEDIVFDPNVLPAGTGIPEHESYAPDFLRACVWIRDNCPEAEIIGGISNLSFGFRGNKKIREAMHAVFIKHAAENGLSMAIVNPAALVPYDEINRELRAAAEAVIFKGGAFDKLLAAGKAGSGGGGNLLTLEEARKNKVNLSWSLLPGTEAGLPARHGRTDFPNLPEILDYPPDPESAGNIITLNNYPIERVIPHIDWTSFVQTWDLAENTYPSAYNKANRKETKETFEKLLEDAKNLLEKIVSGGILRLRGVVGFFPAYSETDDIIIPGAARFAFPRNQERKTDGGANPCLADFILPRELFEKEDRSITPNAAGQLGFFALNAGFGLRDAEEKYRNRKDNYEAFLLAGLSNALADANSEEIHRRVKHSWGSGIRPVFGYPACPDHRDKETVFRLLDVQKRCGMELTDNAMIIPAASVCGMYIAHPDSYYFTAGPIGEDQLQDWARRKDITPEKARNRLSRM